MNNDIGGANQINLNKPLVIIIGSEQNGISSKLLKLSDFLKFS